MWEQYPNTLAGKVISYCQDHYFFYRIGNFPIIVISKYTLEFTGFLVNIIIGNIYRPPPLRELLGSFTNFNEEINRVIQHNIIKNIKVILSGDFNINILKLAEKAAYAIFWTCLLLIHYYQLLHILQK